jgi:hypothetical protein
MIKISGSTHQTFTFPANLEAAFNYYADLNHTLSILPHIAILERYNQSSYRVMYHTTELGIYRVHIICDLEADTDRKNWVLRVTPRTNQKSVREEAGIYSLTAQGSYTSESRFFAQGSQTQVEYKLRLHATLPVPIGVRLMPDSVLNNIARNITQWRIHEIAGGFIERSIRAYR